MALSSRAVGSSLSVSAIFLLVQLVVFLFISTYLIYLIIFLWTNVLLEHHSAPVAIS